MPRYLRTALAILSLPAGLIGYLATAAVIGAVSPALVTTIVGIFVPLFVAGLCMIPFIAPWFDAKAKEDLEHIRAMRERDAADPESRRRDRDPHRRK
jgi:uncharacterized protein YqgC (DUF456 family)